MLKLAASLLLFSLSALADPMICHSSSGAPALVRAEGVAERVSDILLKCSGGNAGFGGTANFTVFFGTNVTAEIVSAPNTSEALLLIDELSSTPNLGVNLIQGTAAGNAVTFYNVPVISPGSGTRTFRITNLKVNAAIGGPGTAVSAFLSISGNTPVPLDSSQFVLGISATGSTFALKDAQGLPASSLAFNSGPQNSALVANPAASGGSVTHQLVFSEGFAQSFRKRNTATTTANPTAAPADQSSIGTDYHSESGFYLSTLPSGSGLNISGLATQGTRLMARFTNIPAGVALYVTTSPLPNSAGSSAALITPANPSGGGPFSATSPTTSANFGGNQVSIAPVSISNGSGTAVWEITDTDAAQQYSFGLLAAYTSGNAGSGVVFGQLGPTATSFSADSTSPVPRFIDNSSTAANCSSSPCVVARPAALSLSYQTATSAPGPYTIQLDTTSLQGLLYQVGVSATQAGWISVLNGSGGTSGVTPDTLSVTFTPGNLTPGVYQATINVSSPTQQFATLVIPVVLTVSTGPSGFVPFGCVANAANWPTIRKEGVSELLGDLSLVCTNGIPTASGAAVPTYNFQVTLPAPVTSRIYNGGWSEALLLIDEPSSSSQLACNNVSGSCPMTGSGAGINYDGTAGHPNVFPGIISGNTVTFPNVPLDPRGTFGQRILRIVNLRVDAAGVPPNGLQTAVAASVSAGALAITTPSPTLGYATPSLQTSVRTIDNFDPSSGILIPQCSPNVPTRAGIIRFDKVFGNAFKVRASSTPYPWTNPDAAPSPLPQNIPGAIWAGIETGFYNPNLTSPVVDFTTVGLADSGTRLRAKITGIPTGARVFVSTLIVNAGPGPISVLTQPTLARLVQSEIGPFAAAPSTLIEGVPAGELTVTNGTATAVWEILATNPNFVDGGGFMVWVQPGTAPTGSWASFAGDYAPAQPPSTPFWQGASSNPLVLPRFVETGAPLQLFKVVGCITFTTPVDLPVAVYGQPYTQTITATGGTPPYTYTGSGIPTGLTLSSSGVLSGSPTASGGFLVRVVDAFGATGSQLFGVVTAPPSALSVSITQVAPLTQGQSGAVVDLTVSNSVSGTIGAVTVHANIPAGLTLTGITGSGWTCQIAAASCTRSDTLFVGQSYAPIALIVNVSPAAPSQVTVSAAVTGGLSPDNNGSATFGVLPASGLTLQVSPAASTLSQTVVLTAALTGGGAGWISFYDGANLLATVPVNAGQAVYRTALLSFGTHQLHVRYSGDPTHGGGDTPSTTQTVRALSTGSFQDSQSFPVPGGAVFARVADLNNDGNADLVLLQPNLTTLVVVLGNGNGTFQTAVSYPLNVNISGFTVADLNRDGKLDILASSAVGSVFVLPGNGDGTFGQASAIPAFQPLGVAVADLNGDGIPDIVVPSGFGIGVLMGNGNGTFQPMRPVSLTHFPHGIVVGDFNNDGKADLVAISYGSGGVQNKTTGAATILLGNGDGYFQSPVDYSAGGADVVNAAITDLNGDGYADVFLTTNAPSDNAVSLLNNGDGTFRAVYNSGGPLDDVSFTDVNGDGVPDALGGTTLLLGNGDGTLTPPIGIGQQGSAIVGGDFNKDGFPDFIAVSGLTPSVLGVRLGASGGKMAVQASHSGNFLPNQIGAPYSIVVSNAAGSQPSAGTVTVVVGLSSGLQFETMGGDGWACSLNSCSRGDALGGGNSYPPIIVTVNVQSNASASQTFFVDVTGGGFAALNVTDPTTIGPTVTADTVSPSSGTGTAQTFVLQYSSNTGATDIVDAWVWFSQSFGAATNSCMVHYSRAANQLYFLNDAATVWSQGTPGANASLSNTQCSIALSGTVVTSIGNSLVLHLAVNFAPGFVGAKNIYMFATDAIGNSGWQTRGTWTVQSVVVSAGSATPASGTGLAQTFQLAYSSTAGATDVTTAWVWINSSFSSASNSCMAYYYRPTNQLNLLTDGGSIWTQGTLGTTTTLSNSQCSINLAQTTAVTSGNTLTLSVPITFAASYGGSKNIYVYASDAANNSGWQVAGTWTVPLVLATVTADSVQAGTGSGLGGSFVFQYSSSAGAADLATEWFWVTSNFSGSAANSCMMYYTRALNQLSLLADNGSTWTSATLGTGATLSNSQCSVNVASATAAVNGTAQTLTLPLTFTAAYAGSKSVYMFASDGPASSGWQNRGTYTVLAASVAAVGVTPNAGSGVTQTFALQYSSTAGASDVTTAWVWIHNSSVSSAANTCMSYYDRARNQISLLTDGGSTWVAAPVGGSSTLSNSQCSINVPAATVTSNGNVLTISLPVTFMAPYAGSKDIYMFAAGSTANSGWQNRGAYTVTAAVATVTADSVTPNVGSALSQTFALHYSSTAGAADLATAWIWFTSNFSGPAANSCMLYYNRALNQLNLLNDNGSTWTPVALGSGTTLGNSQCSVNAAASTAVYSGNTLVITLPVQFASAYAGGKNIYMYANDATGGSGWQNLGTWTVPAVGVSADSVTPSSGSGLTPTFAFQYASAAGAADLSTVWVWFNATFSGAANSCMVEYETAANRLNLLRDDGATWINGIVGSGGTLTNSQCSINLANVSVALNGNQLTLQLPVTFAAVTFSGAKNVYMYANDAITSSGWQTRGSWTVTP